jgi:hypothetical protein
MARSGGWGGAAAGKDMIGEEQASDGLQVAHGR